MALVLFIMTFATSAQKPLYLDSSQPIPIRVEVFNFFPYFYFYFFPYRVEKCPSIIYPQVLLRLLIHMHKHRT